MRILREYTANITVPDPRLVDMLGELETVPLVGPLAGASLWPARRLPDRVQRSSAHAARSVAAKRAHASRGLQP